MAENCFCTATRLRCNEHHTKSLPTNIKSNLNNRILPYFTRNEVVIHNCIDDCWLSFLGIVMDLTRLIQQNIKSPAIKPILAFAGKDISHWFDPKTGDVSTELYF